MEEAGAVELVGGEGEFEGGRWADGLALAGCVALTCQHLGDVELADAVADAVVHADHEKEPVFDEVSLHTEEFQWTHGWMIKAWGGTEIFWQQLLLGEMAFSQFLYVIFYRKIFDSQVSFPFIMVPQTYLLFSIPRLWRLRTAASKVGEFVDCLLNFVL